MKISASTLFLLLAGLFLLPACGDDGDDMPDNLSGELTISGGWGHLGNETNIAEKISPIVAGLTDEQLDQLDYTRDELIDDLNIFAVFLSLPIATCDQNDAAIFNADGTVTANYIDDCGSDVFIQSFNPIAPDPADNETSTWVRNGNAVTITTTGDFGGTAFTDVETFEIVELTATSLKLRVTEESLEEQLFEGEDLGDVNLEGLFIQLNFTAL
ncbi:MAG: lipocalin family protein [Bacteroidota bacterium]